MGTNKNKILLILRTSKTHSEANFPQKIKITGMDKEIVKRKCIFCPFNIMHKYIRIRGGYQHKNKQFFVFSDASPVHAEQARKVLRQCLDNLGFNSQVYDFHSLRSGRMTDLCKQGLSMEEIRKIGCW